MKIYTSLLSANGRKPVAVCRYLELEPDIEEIDVYAGEGESAHYLTINPLGKIPTLVDNDVALFESNAILQYIAERYGNYKLLSHNPAKRAKINQWMFWESSHWQPILTQILSGHVAATLFSSHQHNTIDAPNWQDVELTRHLQLLEKALMRSKFLCGDFVTLADFSVADMTTYFKATHFPFTRYPALAKWYQRMNELDCWRNTYASPWKS